MLDFLVLSTLCIALSTSLRKQAPSRPISHDRLRSRPTSLASPRAQFLFYWNIMKSKDDRIEQLHGEKERLDYERRVTFSALISARSPPDLCLISA